jgi:glycoprotein endo-alpha-1,2-mannosidase
MLFALLLTTQLSSATDDGLAPDGSAAAAGNGADSGSDNAAPVQAAEFPKREVHAFFYLWYGIPETDARYLHWNHSILPHWDSVKATQWPSGVLGPPDDIGATYFPARGLYSSCDPATLREQMHQARQEAGIDVMVASWWPRGRPDGQGVDTDRCMLPLLDAAEEAGVTVAVHLEPYEGRNPTTVRDDIAYLHEQYGSHPALHRFARRPGSKPLPMVYIYDSYHNPPEQWAELLQPSQTDGSKPQSLQSIRGTELDIIAIGLLIEAHDRSALKSGGFDGFYTYFAATGATFGASTRNWPTLARWAREDGMEFIPSVGPGYDDTRIRPWNGANRRPRERGTYYRRMWDAATSPELLAAGSTRIVSITSYNEWGEGTQIEPAAPFVTSSGEVLQHYGDGEDDGPELYLHLTAQAAQRFKQQHNAQALPPPPQQQQQQQPKQEQLLPSQQATEHAHVHEL